jgi:hypothetical protein
MTRTPRIIARTLRAVWGKLRGESPNICYAWGVGCSSSDARLLHYALTGKHWDRVAQRFENSLVEELAARGYDLRTLRFEIKKLPDDTTLFVRPDTTH